MTRMAMILVAAVAVSAGACASASPEQQAANRVEVQIVNELAPSSEVTMWAVRDGGNRQRLGSVGPGDTGTFSFQATSGGRYRLLAQTTTGGELTSQEFTPVPPETITWHLRGLGSPSLQRGG